jgi:hypothetical protein
MTKLRSEIALFIWLVFALSLGPYLLVIHAKHLTVGGGLVVGILMWMPATAAFLSCRILGVEIANPRLGLETGTFPTVRLRASAPLRHSRLRRMLASDPPLLRLLKLFR